MSDPTNIYLIIEYLEAIAFTLERMEELLKQVHKEWKEENLKSRRAQRKQAP